MMGPKITRVLLLFSAFLLAACAMEGGEVTNPPGRLGFKGSLRTASGAPAAGAKVHLYPAGHDPVADGELTTRRIPEDVTDSGGDYAFDALDTGTYVLWAYLPGDGTMALVRGLHPDSVPSDPLRMDTLTAPGALSIPVPDSLPSGRSYVYLAGTPLSAPLDSAARAEGFAILDSVPAGFSPPIHRKVEGAKGPGELVAEDVLVQSGDTTPVLPGWIRSRRIGIDLSGAGLGGGALRNFPLLVRLDQDNFDFQQARSDGADIRFTDTRGRPLDFEMEVWDRTSSRAAFWVRMDSLRASDPTQAFRIHWGRPGAEPASRPRAVFDSAVKWAGVWHLSNMGLGMPPVLEDASVAANHAQAGEYPGGAEIVEAPIGNGIRQNGQPSLLFTSRKYANPGDMTLSLWFRTTTDSGGLLIGFNALQLAADSTLQRDRHVWMDDTGKIHYGIFMNGQPTGQSLRILSSPASYNDGKWHCVAATLSSGTVKGMVLYVDGIKVGENPDAGPAQNYAGYWRMGFTYRFSDWPFPPSGRYFKGDLDEVRAAHQALPVDWLKLSYESQKDGAAVLRHGP